MSHKPDLSLIPGNPSPKALAALIKKFTGKEPDPVEHAEAMERIDAAFDRALAAKATGLNSSPKSE